MANVTKLTNEYVAYHRGIDGTVWVYGPFYNKVDAEGYVRGIHGTKKMVDAVSSFYWFDKVLPIYEARKGGAAKWVNDNIDYELLEYTQMTTTKPETKTAAKTLTVVATKVEEIQERDFDKEIEAAAAKYQADLEAAQAAYEIAVAAAKAELKAKMEEIEIEKAMDKATAPKAEAPKAKVKATTRKGRKTRKATKVEPEAPKAEAPKAETKAPKAPKAETKAPKAKVTKAKATKAPKAKPAYTYRELQQMLKAHRAAGNEVGCKLNAKTEVLTTEAARLGLI